MRSRVLAGLMAGLFVGGVAVAEDPAKLPAPTSYVSDFAGVMDEGSKAQIEALCTQVDQKAHAQIAVVTVNTLDGDSIEDFTTQLYDKWKIGAKGTDKGLLMVLAIKDHKRRIEVGPGLQGILPDAKAGDIGRSMVPQLQQGQYGPAVLTGVQQIAAVIGQDAGVSFGAPQIPVQQYHAPMRRSRGFNWGIIIFFIVIFLLFRGGRGGGGGGLGWFLLGNMMGGGFGGGRRGGDGDFGGGDGGGGGGFGGFGGGSSDGGGASGDW